MRACVRACVRVDVRVPTRVWLQLCLCAWGRARLVWNVPMRARISVTHTPTLTHLRLLKPNQGSEHTHACKTNTHRRRTRAHARRSPPAHTWEGRLAVTAARYLEDGGGRVSQLECTDDAPVVKHIRQGLDPQVLRLLRKRGPPQTASGSSEKPLRTRSMSTESTFVGSYTRPFSLLLPSVSSPFKAYRHYFGTTQGARRGPTASAGRLCGMPAAFCSGIWF